MSKVLFGTLTYENDSEYTKFLQELDQPNAVAMLVAAAAYAQGKGIYSLSESEVIINSIRKLVSQEKFDEMIVATATEEKSDGPTN